MPTLTKPTRAQQENTRGRTARAISSDLEIPDPLNQQRRDRCEADDEEWLRTYCADVFYNPFTKHQQRIIADCSDSLQWGMAKCKAAPRGDGKSSIVKYLALKYALTRQVKFPLIIAATSSKAKSTLSSIKRRLASRNETDLLHDYPLECYVARYVHAWPSRCRGTTGNGLRKIHVEWGSDQIIIPTWEDEEPLGPILVALGITSDDLQGCNVYDIRPDFVMLDDLDSRDSLAAENGVIAWKIEEAIDKTVSGLGGQSRKLGQFFLCTITSRKSAAYKYSDPTQKPAYSGERIAAIQTWPTRADHWETYMEIRQAGQQPDGETGKLKDPWGRKAQAYYAENLDEMNAGAVLANPYNFRAELLPDGTQIELSALQRCYDFISDHGMPAFLTEYQNDPPEDTGPVESGITPNRIQRQTNGYDRRVVPPGCTIVTQGIDIRKIALHWTVRAWRPCPDGGPWTGHTIDYGITEVVKTKDGKDADVDRNIIRALHDRADWINDSPYIDNAGEIFSVSYSLVDSGWRTEVVYRFCDEAAGGYYPAIGHGRSAGCARVNFSSPTQHSPTKLIGWRYFYAMRPNGSGWLVHMDADHWKAWEHDRWMGDPEKTGGLLMWGVGSNGGDRMSTDEKAHHSYARHICAENEVEEPGKDGVMKRYWKSKSDNNHWLDASYRCNVAAAIAGVRLFGMPMPEQPAENMGDEPGIINFGR